MSRSLKVCAFFFLLLFSASASFSQNPEPTGWYAGDMHVHRSCGGSPVSVATLQGRMSEENLAAISLLADMGNAEVQNAPQDLPKVNGQNDSTSTAGHIVHWDAEWHWDATYSQYGHQALGGHLVALGLKEAHQIWQESTWPIFDWTHKQNGIAGFAHMQYLNDTIQTSLNCCIPMEYPVEVALGAADFVSEDVNGSDDAIAAYYRLLNSGFRPGFAAGTDYPCNNGSIGNPLTYVRVADGNMTYRNWIEGISNGRTVVSRNGHNEFLDLKVNSSAAPGDEIRLTGTGSVAVTVTWTAAANLSGTIELVQNGVLVASKSASVSSGSGSTLSATVNFTKSGWLAARRMGNGEHAVHTAAVFVTVNAAPVRANATDPNFYVQWTDNLLTKTSSGGEWNWYFPTSLSSVQTRYRSAKALYQQIALEAQGTSTTLSSITVTPTNQTIAPNTTQQFKATGTYSNGTTLDLTGQVAWSSSNPNIAKINLRGLAVAVNTGSAVISATLGALSDSTSAVVQTAPLTITTDALAAGTVNVAYSATLAASGGTPQYTWSRTGGSLPTGLTLNGTTGVISGTPTVAGTFGFTLQVADVGSPAQTATKSFSILVGSAGTCPCSVFGSTTPALVDSGADSPVELGMKFKSDMAGLITAIRFYKSAANTGTHVGNLWTSAGTKLATVTFANETTSGWQQATLTPAVSITANTIYVVSYHANNGHYSDDYPYFGNAVDNPPLHALADGASGANGVYAYGSSSAFPDQGWNSSNYWVDVFFSTSSTTTYTISGTVSGAGASGTTITLSGAGTGTVTTDASGAFSFSGLANGAYTLTPSKTGFTFTPTSQGVAVSGANVSNVTFASAAQVVPYSMAGTITGPGASAATLTLSGAATGTTTSDASGNYTFTNLNNGSYTVTPSKAGFTFAPASEAVVVNGANVTAVNFVSTANSGGTPNCPCSIWNSSTLPAIASEADTAAVELGVRFRADVDGVITGLRFYKGPNNTGTHIGNLWTNAGAVLGSVVFANETATGWQQMNFSRPIAITAGTTYVASYHTDTGGYSFTGNYFTAAFDNAPLHALADGFDGVNGVFRYGSSGFPSSGFQSGNYWVDVVFTTTTVQGHSISGTVSGPGANGAILTLSGAASAATTADPTGSYRFNGLADGTYAVAASKAGYTYSGPVQNIAVAGADVTGVNFTSAAQTFKVSGTVTGAGASGVLISLTGAATSSTTTDSSGSYSFLGLANGSYTLRASKAGYVFTPASQSVTIAGTDVVATTFASAATYSISGTITGAASTGATVTLSGTSSATATTDSSGNFSFTVVNGTYTITPTKSGYAFTPTNRSVTVSGAAVAGVNFTSASSGPACPCSIWSSTTVPAVAADSDTKAVELGVRFRSDVDGYITGIRYYKSSTNTGTHIGTLWSNTGTKLATATFTSETATGWQTVLFAQLVAVKAGTTYVASYHTNTGHYAVNENYFGTTFDNAPLHALASGVSGNNGIYKYGASTVFPTSVFKKSNYWVDVVFKTTLP